MTNNKNVYVFAEQREGVIQPVALELIGKARDLADVLGDKVVAIFPGHNIADQANELIAYGADDVIVVDAPELKDYVTEQYTQAVFQVITAMNPDIVLFGATTIGRDLAPRLSARLEKGLTADCTKLEISDGSDPKLEARKLMMTRPAFGGNLMATIICPRTRPQMSTVRPGVMQKMEAFAPLAAVIVKFSKKVRHLLTWNALLSLFGNATLADEMAQIVTIGPVIKQITEENVEGSEEEKKNAGRGTSGGYRR